MTPKHTTAINSQCWTGWGGHHHVLGSKKLTAYLLRNSMRGSTTLVLMYIKPRHVICNGDFSLLRIKPQDVIPWGLVDRPKQFGGTCCSSSSWYKSSFLLTLKMDMPLSTNMFVPVCQTPTHHIPWTHNLNTFYTENTDFAHILLAIRVAQHDSLAEIGPQFSCVMQESWLFF